MARGTSAYNVQRFTGLNTSVAATLVADGEATYSMNLVSDPRGALSTRAGFTTKLLSGTGASGYDTVFPMEPGDNNGIGSKLLFVDNGTLGWFDANTWTPTNIVSGLGVLSPWKFIRAPAIGGQGPYWGMNGSGTPKQVTTANVAASWTATTGTVPNGKFMIYAGNRVWVAGVASNPNAVYYSEVGDPTNWPAANVTQFGVDDGLPITGLGVCGSYVLVFKQSSVWRIYDLDTSANVRISNGAGTLQARTIVDTDDACFFVDPNLGVCKTDGATIERLSDAVLPTVASMTGLGTDIQAVFWQGSYYLHGNFDAALGGVAGVLQFDTKTGSWWAHKIPAKFLTLVTIGSLPAQLFGSLIGVTGRFARLFDPAATTDDGVAITTKWTSGRLDFGQPQASKRLRQVVVGGAGTMSVDVISNFGATTDTYAGVPAEEPIFAPGSSQAFQFSISGTGPTKLTGLEALYDLRRGRG